MGPSKSALFHVLTKITKKNTIISSVNARQTSLGVYQEGVSKVTDEQMNSHGKEDDTKQGIPEFEKLIGEKKCGENAFTMTQDQ